MLPVEILQFLILLLVAPAPVPKLASNMAVGEVVDVLVMVRLLSVPPLKEPLIVTSVGASGGFEADGRPSVFKRSLSLIESGQIDVSTFITHHFRSFTEVSSALSSGMQAEDYIKGVVVL